MTSSLSWHSPSHSAASALCRPQPPLRRGHVTSVLWDPADLHTERGKTRLPLPPPSSCAVPEDPASLLSPTAVLMLMEARIILPPSLSPVHLSRPLLLTHQRQCTAYSLPAATMETGVVVYDSERPVCREIDRKRDTQRRGKRDKEQDLLTRSMNQWLHVDGIKNLPPLKVRCLVSNAAMLLHWCSSRNTETEVRCSGGAKCMCDADTSEPSRIVYHSSLRYITHVPLQWATTDPANGQKFISSEPLGGGKERHKKRDRQEGTRLLCAPLEGEMDHG